MADAQPTRNFYVYILYREDGATPFYVGIGRRERRWLEHEKLARRGQGRHKDNIICDMKDRGIIVPKARIAVGLDKTAAVLLEVSLIWLLGRAPAGPLVNQTAGGDGVIDVSPETLERMAAHRRGKVASPETRAKISAIVRGRPMPQGAKDRIRAAKLGQPRSEATKAKIRTANLGKRQTDDDKAKKRAALLGRKHSPERAERIRQGLLRYYQNKKGPAEIAGPDQLPLDVV